MATLTINGKRVKVDDSFLSLSPEQQNATVDEIAQSLGAQQAPEAAQAASEMSAMTRAINKPMDDGRNSVLGKIDTVMRGAADTLTFGTADEIAAGLNTGFGYLGDYEKELASQRRTDTADAENRFGYRLGGQLGGGVVGGVGLTRTGLSLGANAARAGQGFGRVAAGSAADGLVLVAPTLPIVKRLFNT